MKARILLLITSVVLVSLLSCKEPGHKKHKEKKTEKIEALSNESLDSEDSHAAANCDTSLWRFVYNPERLQVIAYCKTVTGVIEESNADDDGDQHMLLKLDNGQKDLLTKKNKTKKQGDLVIEAVCANKVKLKKVGTTCNGYINHLQLPTVGAHVRVTGSLVNDTHNGWNEIHPITKVEVLQ